jgi:hypothetical protein
LNKNILILSNNINGKFQKAICKIKQLEFLTTYRRVVAQPHAVMLSRTGIVLREELQV